MFLPLKKKVASAEKDKGEGSLINTKTGKLELGESVMETLVFQQIYFEFPLQFCLLFGVQKYRTPHQNAFKLFGSLARRYTTAYGKFLCHEKPRLFSFTVAHFLSTGCLIERI